MHHNCCSPFPTTFIASYNEGQLKGFLTPALSKTSPNTFEVQPSPHYLPPTAFIPHPTCTHPQSPPWPPNTAVFYVMGNNRLGIALNGHP